MVTFELLEGTQFATWICGSKQITFVLSSDGTWKWTAKTGMVTRREEYTAYNEVNNRWLKLQLELQLARMITDE